MITSLPSQHSNTPTLHHSIRSIVHLDADAFFASVEQAADSRLRGKAIAVGGEKRGIIASASYEARKFGIYTPMPTVRARRLCPKLIIVPGDFEKYERFSRWMFSYAYDFTPDVEVGSIDEGYLDLSGACKPPVEIAEILQRAIRQSLKITVSEGIGSNKLVSQIASKLHKPAAFFRVVPGEERPFLHPLANRWLPGVGPETATRMNAAGLALIGQVAATPLEFLGMLVGSYAPQLRYFANGIDDRPVVREPPPAKSYGHQETFAQDTTDEDFMGATLRRMADSLMATVRAEGKAIRTVTVKVRYNDMAEDQRSESLSEPTDLETDLYGRLRVMLKQAWKRRVSLRMVSLKLSNIYGGFGSTELPLEANARQREARQRLAATVDELREKFGRRACMREHDLPYRTRCEHRRSADFQSAVSQVSNLRHAATTTNALPIRNRRYGRLEICATRRVRPYVPLNVRSYYSFLDSTLSVEAIVDLAKRYELPAIALTDKGNLHGAVEFVMAAKAAGIKPILGAETEINGSRVWLYVEKATGYGNLCRILSHQHPSPRPSPTGRGGIAFHVSGIGAFVSRTDSIRHSLSLRERAGVRGIQCMGTIREENSSGLSPKGTDGLIALSSDPSLAPLFANRFYLADQVAIHPIHYAEPSDHLKYNIVQSIRTLTLLRQEHPEKRLAGDFHFPSPAEMGDRFDDDHLARTREIADRCNFDFELGKLQFPAFQPPDDSTPKAFLHKLVWEGFRRRYPKHPPNVRAQIEEELAIISDVGYEEYFLVVWDLLQECQRHGIDWITRGSAADSLVCYCLSISDVCPIRFDLYFRRFLNKERMALNKLPDIDVDFPHDRKDDVIDLIFEKYGAEHTAVVGGFSTYHARSALADVAKVLGVSEHHIRRFTERVPHVHARDIEQAIAQRAECGDLPVNEEPYATALKMAQFLDGFPRYPKMHPCGVVLSRAPMADLVPCFTSNKGYPTTHFDMDAVEAIGLVKIDILAQGGLAAMRDVKNALAKRGMAGHPSPSPLPQGKREYGTPSPSDGVFPLPAGGEDKGEGESSGRGSEKELDLRALEPWDDPEVWEMIANGGARAVHHIESPAMISLCRMCNVREIDGLIAIVSVIRPGAANEQKKMSFTRRYQGLEPVIYPHPSLEDCLKSTFGMIVYEEHILQICEAFAGLPPGRADVLRRGLVKQNRKMVEEVGKDFVRCACAKGRSDSDIVNVWRLVCGFNGYAFCKAHSTAYGVEAYQSAWLKRYYPAEFMAAVLSNGKGFYQPLVYVLECHRLGIPLLPPWVNEPGPLFTVVAASVSEWPSDPPPKTFGGAGATAPTSCPRFRGLRPLPAPPLRVGAPQIQGYDVGAVAPAGSDMAIRVPATRVKGLTERTRERMVAERERGEFESLTDFYRRVAPANEEMELLLKTGAFDGFGKSRTALFWEIQHVSRAFRGECEPNQGRLFASPEIDCVPDVPLTEPTRLQRLKWETELFDFAVSGHPLELHDDIAWDTYCHVADLGNHIGETVVCCGLIIEDRIHEQVTGEPMKFLTLADWTGIVETELFATTYKSYGLATVRYPVLEITATVEPYENGRGFSLRVHRAGKPRYVPAK